MFVAMCMSSYEGVKSSLFINLQDNLRSPLFLPPFSSHPLCSGVDLMILLFGFKGLNGAASCYNADLLIRYLLPRSQRSTDLWLLAVPGTCWRKGGCDFSVAATKLWNKLPVHVKTVPSLPVVHLILKVTFTPWIWTQFKSSIVWPPWSYFFYCIEFVLFSMKCI